MLKKALVSSLGLYFFSLIPVLKVNAIEYDTHKGTSGYYGSSMIIGVDQNNDRVTGYYENYRGWDENTQTPLFSCIFYFTGELQGDNYQIRSWNPEFKDVIDGNLTFAVENDKPTFNLKLEKEHGGCWNVNHFADEKGASFQLEKNGDWISLEVVSVQKAFFHSSPNIDSKTKSYVIKGDILRIFNRQNEWLEAEFGTEKVTRAWIKKSALDRL